MPKRRWASLWPDFMKLQTLAARLDIEPAYAQQLVNRGVLPPPNCIGEAERYHIDDVYDWLRRAGEHVQIYQQDPYTAGVARVAPSEARDKPSRPRSEGEGEGKDLPVPDKGSRH